MQSLMHYVVPNTVVACFFLYLQYFTINQLIVIAIDVVLLIRCFIP